MLGDLHTNSARTRALRSWARSWAPTWCGNDLTSI